MELITPRPLTPEKIAAQTREFTRYDVADGDPETNQDIAELSTIRAASSPAQTTQSIFVQRLPVQLLLLRLPGQPVRQPLYPFAGGNGRDCCQYGLDHPHHGVFITSAVYRKGGLYRGTHRG